MCQLTSLQSLRPGLVLLLALAACSQPLKDQGHNSGRMNRYAQNDCDLTDLGERSVVYNSDGLSDVRHKFLEHFRLDSNGTEIQETRPVLSLKQLGELVARIDSKTMQVDAIMVHYGLSAGAFKPVIRFLHQNRDNAAYLPVDSTYYHIAAYELDTLDAATAKAWTKAYFDSVWVSLDGNGFTPVKDSPGGNPSPTGEWFRYTDHIVRLKEENRDADPLYLVINCISESVCYNSLGFLNDHKPQYVHLLALNLRDSPKGTDLLHNGSPSAASLKQVAVDLGNVCPPRCK